MTSLSFACFTPSLMPENLLERTFVAREPILKTIMKRVEKLGKTPSPNHTLLVGSYGVGKTHLISLAYHRSVKLADGQRNTSLRIASARNSVEDPLIRASSCRDSQPVLPH